MFLKPIYGQSFTHLQTNFSKLYFQMMFNNHITTRVRSITRQVKCCFLIRTMSTENSEIIFNEIEDKGVIILNRPKALNAFNLNMLQQMLPVLKKWETSKKLVLIKGAGGKAFCAGGDVRSVVEAGRKGDIQFGLNFFRTEYTVNGIIGSYKIPYVALIDGIIMGGGVGLSVHGKYRVATEKTFFAMPETQIGIFPQLSGSHFLPKTLKNFGAFLALTGHRLKGWDVVNAGIATHFCKSEQLGKLEEEILETRSENDLQQVLEKFHKIETNPGFSLDPYMDKIEKCFEGDVVENIVKKLESDGSEWAKSIRELLQKMSPTSLKITLREVRLGNGLSLDECLKLEFNLAVNCLKNKDFYEGIRALLIDKDQNPKWDPATLEKVTDEYVNSYFEQAKECDLGNKL